MFEFIAYGGADIYQSIFSALAMITGSNASSSLINLTMVLGLIVAMVKAMTDANIGQIFRWFFTAAIIYGILWVPKVTVQVTDKLNPSYVTATVANVPLGVGATAALVSQVGDRAIALTELAFSDPADSKYSKYGAVFGAKLMSKISAARPANQIYAANLNYYMTNCAIYDINDQTVKVEDLASSKDTWATLTANPHPMRMTDSLNASGNMTTVSCQQLVTILNTGMDATTDEALANITQASDPSTDASSSLTKGTNVMNGYLSIIGETEQNARRIMRNAITRNGLSDAIAASGNTGLTASLGEELAHDQTKKTQGFLGAAGETAIPVLKIVVECLFIGIFPVIFPLFLMPKVGLSSAKMYLVGFFYLQLWGPMYVILHKIMMFYAYQKAHAATIAFGTPSGLNMITLNAVADANSDITTLAGSMSLMIPVMAGLVTKGAMAVGAQGEALLGQFRSGAEAAGSATATGNFTLGSNNFETNSMHTMTANSVTANKDNQRVEQDRYGYRITSASGDIVTMNDHRRATGFEGVQVRMAGGAPTVSSSESLESSNRSTDRRDTSFSKDRTVSTSEENATTGSMNYSSTLVRANTTNRGLQNDNSSSQSREVGNTFSQGVNASYLGRFEQNRGWQDSTNMSFSNNTSGSFGGNLGRGSGANGGGGGVPGFGTGAGSGGGGGGGGSPFSLGGNQSFGLSSGHDKRANNGRSHNYSADFGTSYSGNLADARQWSRGESSRGYVGSSTETANRAEVTKGTNLAHSDRFSVGDTFRVGETTGIAQERGISSGLSYSLNMNGDTGAELFDWYMQSRQASGQTYEQAMANFVYAQRTSAGIRQMMDEYRASRQGGYLEADQSEFVGASAPDLDFNVRMPAGAINNLSDVGSSKKVDSALQSGDIGDLVPNGVGRGGYNGFRAGVATPGDAPTLEGGIATVANDKIGEVEKYSNEVVRPEVRNSPGKTDEFQETSKVRGFFDKKEKGN